MGTSREGSARALLEARLLLQQIQLGSPQPEIRRAQRETALPGKAYNRVALPQSLVRASCTTVVGMPVEPPVLTDQPVIPPAGPLSGEVISPLRLSATNVANHPSPASGSKRENVQPAQSVLPRALAKIQSSVVL